MTRFERPPLLFNSEGHVRRCGFEFEFAGVGLERSVEIVRELFGGEKKMENRFAYQVVNTRYGTFGIESDSSLLKDRRYEKYLDLLGIDSNTIFGRKLEELIESVSSDLVPFEVISPPIPMDDLESIEALRQKLMEAGAQGTFAHVYAAYGMQFNPEMPGFEVETLLSYMRAFFLLFDRIKANSEVPIARKVLPFIDPFPEKYIQKVLDPSYSPDRETFMRDYLIANPTRNRALDWLPLFSYLDKDLCFSYEVERHLIKPRPTLHYRLPSSLIDDPEWSIASEWNKWIEVERLAADPEKIRKMSEDYLLIHGPFQLRAESRWLRRSEEWLSGTP